MFCGAEGFAKVLLGGTMKIPRIKNTERVLHKGRRKLLPIVVFVLILTGASLSRRSSNNQDSQTTPPDVRISASSSATEFSSGFLQPRDDSNKLGMEKIAEMTALARHSEICAEVPREWSAAFIVLLIAAPPTEEQVEAQERKILALAETIGPAKWCQLYAVEMQEAFLVYKSITNP